MEREEVTTQELLNTVELTLTVDHEYLTLAEMEASVDALATLRGKLATRKVDSVRADTAREIAEMLKDKALAISAESKGKEFTVAASLALSARGWLEASTEICRRYGVEVKHGM